MIGHEKRMSSDKLTRSSKAIRVNSIDQEKFRSSLNLMEQDRHHLLQSLREIQKKNELEVEKNFELGRNLNCQADHIKSLESENDELVSKVKSLQSRLEEIEGLYSSLVQERGNLKLTVAQLQDEVQVTKLQASDKEVYIEKLACSYNDEKETILNVHGKHSKLLTSKILFDSVAKVAAFRLNWAFSAIRTDIIQNSALGKVLFSLLKKFVEKRARFALRGLKDNVRDDKVRVIIERFVENGRKSKVQRKVWKVLKDLARCRKKINEKLVEGIRKTSVVYRSRLKVRVLRFLTQWKNVKVKDLYGKRILWGLIVKKYQKSLGSTLAHWSKVQKIFKQLQANEDLASDLSAFTLKQSVFYEFKRITQLSIQRKKLNLFTYRLQVHKNKQKVLTELSLFKSLQKQRKSRLQHLCLYFSNRSVKSSYLKWRSFLFQVKKTSNLSKVFKSHLKHSSFLGVNKFYMAWKLFVSQNKFQRTSKRLASELPKREKFESDFKELLSLNHQAMMTKVITNMMRSSKNIVRSYWFTWQSLVYSFNQSKKKVGRRFFQVYTQLCQDSVASWKEFVKKSRLAQLASSHQEVNEENLVLLDHINNLETCLKETNEAKNTVSVFYFGINLKTIQRKTKISLFRRWAQVALKISNYLTGGTRLETVLYFNLVRDGLTSLQLFQQRKARKETMNKKLYVFTFKKWKKFNGFMIESWLNFVRLNKYHRSKLVKILTKKYRKTTQISTSFWKSWLYSLNRNEGEVRFEVLENQFNQVREELEDVCNCLTIEKDKTWTLEELLRFKYVRRLVLSLKAIHSRALAASVFRWTGFVTCARLRLKYLCKMMNYNKKLDIKACMQVWAAQKNLAKQLKSNSSISALLADKKNLRRDMNSMKSSLESELKAKAEQISQQIREKQVLTGRLDKLFQISARKQNETLTLPKSHVTFTKWKEVYLHKKLLLSKLIRTTIKAKQARAFRSIQAHVRSLELFRAVQAQHLSLFLSFRSRKLKHAFHWWTHRSHQAVHGDQSKEIQVFTHKLNALAMRLHKSRQSSLNKSMKFVTDRKKLLMILAWRKVTRKEKMIREAGESFQCKSFELKGRFAVDQWRFFTCYQIRNKEFARVMMLSRFEKLGKLAFESWRNFHLAGKTVEKGLKTISFHYSRELLNFGLHSIQTYAAQRGTHSQWFRYCRDHLTKVTLTIFTKQDLGLKFKVWASQSRHISRILTKLQKILKSTNSRLKRKGFKGWSFKLKLLEAILQTETLGKSARSLRKLSTVMQVIQKFIKSEGLPSRYFDEYQMTHLPSRLYFWSRSFDKSDILAHRFLLWKIFSIKRQKIRFTAFRMNVFRNKGGLVQKFGIWKKSCPGFSDSIKRLPRHELIHSLILLERQEKDLQESLKEKHVSLKYLESYTDILEEHVRRGQNQALARCAGQIHKTMQDSLFRWLFNSQLSRLVENDFHIRDLEQELMYSRRKCKDFDIENKELIVENKGLLTALMKAEDIIMKTTRLN